MTLEAMKLALIDDWRKAYKFASVRMSLFLSAIGAYIVADPHAIESLWNSIPADIRSDLPGWLRGVFTFAIVASALIASRLLRKKPKCDDRSNTTQNEAG